MLVAQAKQREFASQFKLVPKTTYSDGIYVHHEHKGPGRRQGQCCAAKRRFGRSGGASRLFEALLLELGVDLGQQSISGPERRDELVSTRGVGGADLGPKCGAYQCQARMLHSRRCETAFERCQLTLVSTLMLPARRRASVMVMMSTLAAVVPAAVATAALYLSCLVWSKSALLLGEECEEAQVVGWIRALHYL